MKKILAFFCLVVALFGCFLGVNASHDLVKQLGQKKETLVKNFGEAKMSEPYGATTRLSYDGEFSGVEGTWSYYVLDSDGSVVSAEFTAKGEHQDIFLESLVKTLGQPLTVEEMTVDVPSDDVMGTMVIGQIKQRHEDGMRVWRNDKNGTTYILDVAPEKGGEALVTTIVSLDEKKLSSIENAADNSTDTSSQSIDQPETQTDSSTATTDSTK